MTLSLSDKYVAIYSIKFAGWVVVRQEGLVSESPKPRVFNSLDTAQAEARYLNGLSAINVNQRE